MGINATGGTLQVERSAIRFSGSGRGAGDWETGKGVFAWLLSSSRLLIRRTETEEVTEDMQVTLKLGSGRRSPLAPQVFWLAWDLVFDRKIPEVGTSSAELPRPEPCWLESSQVKFEGNSHITSENRMVRPEAHQAKGNWTYGLWRRMGL